MVWLNTILFPHLLPHSVPVMSNCHKIDSSSACASSWSLCTEHKVIDYFFYWILLGVPCGQFKMYWPHLYGFSVRWEYSFKHKILEKRHIITVKKTHYKVSVFHLEFFSIIVFLFFFYIVHAIHYLVTALEIQKLGYKPCLVGNSWGLTFFFFSPSLAYVQFRLFRSVSSFSQENLCVNILFQVKLTWVNLAVLQTRVMSSTFFTVI